MKKVLVSVLLSLILFTTALPVFSETVGEAKRAADGTLVSITGVATFVDSTECYIEAADRSAALRVVGDTSGIQAGDSAAAGGLLATVNGERVVSNAAIKRLDNGSTVLTPFAMNNKAIGGGVSVPGPSLMDYSPVKVPGDGYRLQWVSAGGADNTGMLIKTRGRVTAVSDDESLGGRWFYIDDGSAVAGDFGDAGVLVYSDAAVKEGQYVSVTGISGMELALDTTDKLMRVIQTRNADDVVVLKDVEEKQYPFSDEFDGPEIDKRWGTVNLGGTLSLSDTPGSLTIIPAPNSGISTPYPMQIEQQVTGDWDLEYKVKPDFADTGQITVQSVNLMIKVSPNSPVNPPYDTQIGLASVGQSTGGRSVYLLGHSVNAMDADWYYFRIRSRSGVFYGSVSTDGVDYSQEYSSPGTNSGFMSLYGFCQYVSPYKPVFDFHAHIDYFRLTSAAQ